MFSKLIRRISSSFTGSRSWPREGDDKAPQLGSKRRMSEDDDEDEHSGSLSKRSRAHDPATGPNASEDGTIVSEGARKSSPPSPLSRKDTEEVAQVTNGVQEVELEDKKEQVVSEDAEADVIGHTASEDSPSSKETLTSTIVATSATEQLVAIPEASESTNVVLVLDEPKAETSFPSDETPEESVAVEQDSSAAVESKPAEEAIVAKLASSDKDKPAVEVIEILDDPAGPTNEVIDLSISPTLPAASLPLPPSPDGEKVLA